MLNFKMTTKIRPRYVMFNLKLCWTINFSQKDYKVFLVMHKSLSFMRVIKIGCLLYMMNERPYCSYMGQELAFTAMSYRMMYGGWFNVCCVICGVLLFVNYLQAPHGHFDLLKMQRERYKDFQRF